MTSLGNLQLVTISSKLSLKGLVQKGKDVAQKKGVSVPKERAREVVVYILFSDSVAKGHVMLPHSIRHFISADTHSWVYVTKCSANVKKDEPVMTISQDHAKDMLQQIYWTWTTVFFHSEQGPLEVSCHLFDSFNSRGGDITRTCQ